MLLEIKRYRSGTEAMRLVEFSRYRVYGECTKCYPLSSATKVDIPTCSIHAANNDGRHRKAGSS